MAAEALTRKQRDILQDFVFPLANLLLCFFGVFFSPMSTHGKLEMATPKENMKRKMKSTIAQEIMPSSISRSVRLKKKTRLGYFCIFAFLHFCDQYESNLSDMRPPMRAIARVDTAHAGM